MPIVLKFGSLNLLEPSGSFQACNGIALPLPLPLPLPVVSAEQGLVNSAYLILRKLYNGNFCIEKGAVDSCILSDNFLYSNFA